jgi:hypothetical protein
VLDKGTMQYSLLVWFGKMGGFLLTKKKKKKKSHV